MYPIKRNLSGVCFRIKRDTKYQAIDFTDMTDNEQEDILELKRENSSNCEEYTIWLEGLLYRVNEVLRDIADQFNISKNYDEEEKCND